MPGKILVLTQAEQVERDATEFKFSKLVLHISLNSFITTFGNAPFPLRVRQFLQRCASYAAAAREDGSTESPPRRKELLALARKDARNDPVEPKSFGVVFLEKPALEAVLDELQACVPSQKRLRLLICLQVTHGENHLRHRIPMRKRQGIGQGVGAPFRRLS